MSIIRADSSYSNYLFLPLVPNGLPSHPTPEVYGTGAYLEATLAVLQKHSGLSFDDEACVVSRRNP